ncbi:MAG: CoA ester lyase [SAR202 cluster bacterium]|nr:CoA ester lyase [Chloroflexota bacterium]MQG33450.1 CoA ester lyase [SAR202 cluster bacterium]HCP23663.1 CoA ester lyase [Dehalococcoidia bacterium]
MELFRSFIFVPGNRANMLERARNFNADVIMVDLEDSVPPGEKETAREMAKEWVPALKKEGKRVMVRVNSLDTGLTRQELEAVVSPDLYGISLGKVESTWNMRDADRMLSSIEHLAGVEPGSIKMVAWAETASALVDARDIATASKRVVALAFGAEDFTNDMGIERTDTGEEVQVPRSLVPVAARAANVASLDSPFVLFQDPDALRADAQRARQMGYTGKFAIHPAQLDIINETFSPSAEEIAYARQIMAAWEEAEAAGRGSLAMDGRMVDVPVVKRAQNLLAFADAVEAQGR